MFRAVKNPLLVGIHPVDLSESSEIKNATSCWMKRSCQYCGWTAVPGQSRREAPERYMGVTSRIDERQPTQTCSFGVSRDASDSIPKTSKLRAARECT